MDRPDGAPPDSVAEAVLAGAEDRGGSYLVLMKWYPAWMSAPHTCVTDRLRVPVAGVWRCDSGLDLDPGEAVPVYPEGFLRRIAGTPHHDGALPESAVIAVTGTGPVRQAWVDPPQLSLRLLQAHARSR